MLAQGQVVHGLVFIRALHLFLPCAAFVAEVRCAAWAAVVSGGDEHSESGACVPIGVCWPRDKLSLDGSVSGLRISFCLVSGSSFVAEVHCAAWAAADLGGDEHSESSACGPSGACWPRDVSFSDWTSWFVLAFLLDAGQPVRCWAEG